MLKNKRLALLTVLTFLAFTLIYSINGAQDSTHNQLPATESHSTEAAATHDAHGADAHAVEGHTAAAGQGEEKLNAGKDHHGTRCGCSWMASCGVILKFLCR
jgi:hypothetical protein